ncbi:uncharacterized protein LAJ45_03364 [Morchella importuna]|uniref:galacturonan 1,4-alpha-galacturonidase n=1 Tax=Morchella conica CCBAS932 TaxID=1392247 RepID=A0A3N4KW92_9PEZI|nr:uncharacterized protein LAJ45_03364 [Morchella importuna]KAH8152524.1 hypothetical protein LAJ45_03364 [Morchella importuna]RPB13689.1 pectin lyase-like protein [Morchella conica CCBAS932]
MKLTLTLLSVLLAAPSSILSKPVSSNALIPLAPRTNKYRGHYNPGGPRHHAFPQHHHRREVHLRASRNETDDVADEFLAALSEANCGGTLVLKKGKTYVLGKKLDLTFLDDIVVQLDGQILFTDDIAYWQANNFFHPFQNSITFWQWGGKDIVIKGTGEINGNGQAWYDGFAGREILDPNNVYLRPNLFTAVNATGLLIDGITFRNSPCWTNFLITSKDIFYNNVLIEAQSTNANLPKNTDGWDSYNVDGLTVTNARVNIGDDCFSPKPNTTNIFVQNLWCNGTHGVSMGSIGQYSGVMDIIENVYIENVTMHNSQNGARLKAWAGESTGYGRMNNITYKDFVMDNVDYPLILTQCYFNINSTECAKYPSEVNISNVTFINFTGESSGSRGKLTVEVICSPNAVCEDIYMEDIEMTTPFGDQVFTCDGVTGGIGVDCVASNSTEGLAALATTIPSTNL